MSSKMQSSNNIAQARRTVQQLRIEANIERIKLAENNLTRPAEPALMKYSCSDSFIAMLLSRDDSQS